MYIIKNCSSLAYLFYFTEVTPIWHCTGFYYQYQAKYEKTATDDKQRWTVALKINKYEIQI